MTAEVTGLMYPPEDTCEQMGLRVLGVRRATTGLARIRYIIAKLDPEDASEVLGVVMERMLQFQLDEELPVYVRAPDTTTASSLVGCTTSENAATSSEWISLVQECTTS